MPQVSSSGAHTISLDQNTRFSHTESIFNDIHSDCGYIKQELYFGHHRNAVFAARLHTVSCSTNTDSSEHARTICGTKSSKKLLQRHGAPPPKESKWKPCIFPVSPSHRASRFPTNTATEHVALFFPLRFRLPNCRGIADEFAFF